jgi:hypothetical protein
LPLFEKARVEVYVPDLPSAAYRALLAALQREFTYTFGGCTVSRGLYGSYLSSAGVPINDRVNLIYTDASIQFESNMAVLDRFADKLRRAAFDALEEEAVLIATFKVYHSD